MHIGGITLQEVDNELTLSGSIKATYPVKVQDGFMLMDATLEQEYFHILLSGVHSNDNPLPEAFDHTMVFETTQVENPYFMETVFWDADNYRPDLVINAGAAGRASVFERSLIVGAHGGTKLLDGNYTLGVLDYPNALFDTSFSGADLGVEDDLEVLGTIYIDEILESTFNTGVTIEQTLMKDDWLQFDTSIGTPAHSEGLVFYDNEENALAIYVDEPHVTLQVGQEQWVHVRNDTGSTIADGSAVYITGAVGQLPTIALAKADDPATAKVIGVATHDIEKNTNGYVTTSGQVHNLNTKAWSEGDVLYLSASTAGNLTNTPPAAPNFPVQVGATLYSHVTQGSIFIAIGPVDVLSDMVIQGLTINTDLVIRGNGGELLYLDTSTETLEIMDAGSAGATQQDWIKVEVGNATGYVHIYVGK